MKTMNKFLVIGLIVVFHLQLNADIRVSENPTFNTPDLIFENINQILELNQRDHNEALSTIFGIYAEIDQEVLNTMLDSEFTRMKEAVTNASNKFRDQENLQNIADNEPNLSLLKNSLERIRSLEEFNMLLVEVGAIVEGLQHLDTIFQNQLGILELLEQNTTIEEQNTVEYPTQAAQLIAEKIQNMIVPQQRQTLEYLDRNSDDPTVDTFITDKTDKFQTISIIGD